MKNPKVDSDPLVDTSEAAPLSGAPVGNAGSLAFSAYCIVAAFGTYFCMYGFRKPFTAATYEGAEWMGVGFKTILVASQVAGYTLSKFIGIRVVSEMPARYRAVAILAVIGLAEITLLLFAVTPAPWSCAWLFVNGLSLGMVFGLVLGYLEGRMVTEALSAGLCASFILSAGFVKSVGRSVMDDFGVDPYWMPFTTGLLFLAPLLLFVGLLSRIPPPSALDVSLRCERAPMDRSQRRSFFRRHALGLTGLLLIYVLLTILRSLRDDFAVEIWRELGVTGEPTVFARSEFWVMIGVVLSSGFMIALKNNRVAFLATMGLLAGGFVIVIGSILGHRAGYLAPMPFMVILGVGTYIPYVAFHTTVFERMIAAYRETGTIAYLMYLADAVGYLGYVGVMVYRNVTTGEVEFLRLLTAVGLTVGIVSGAITLVVGLHFYYHVPKRVDS